MRAALRDTMCRESASSPLLDNYRAKIVDIFEVSDAAAELCRKFLDAKTSVVLDSTSVDAPVPNAELGCSTSRKAEKPKKKCKIESCSSAVHIHGLCLRHGPKCTVDGCNSGGLFIGMNSGGLRGRCTKHGGGYRRSNDGCKNSRAFKGKGLCKAHRAQNMGLGLLSTIEYNG